MFTRLLLVLAATLSAHAAEAHEFWIEPEDYLVAPGQSIVAHTRVGQEFKGPSYAYIPRNFRRFDVILGESDFPVEMRMGDKPALDIEIDGEGLAVIVQVTTDITLRYTEAEKFRDFVVHKDAAWVLDEHAARGLPETGFVERYSRHAKSLVALVHGEGADRPMGLEIEIVALANPYTDDLSAGLPVMTTYQGAPLSGAQVEIFAKSGKAVTVSTVKSDEAGRALIPVEPGVSYLLDHVVLRAVEGKAKDKAVWESLWASLTFAVPD